MYSSDQEEGLQKQQEQLHAYRTGLQAQELSQRQLDAIIRRLREENELFKDLQSEHDFDQKVAPEAPGSGTCFRLKLDGTQIDITKEEDGSLAFRSNDASPEGQARTCLTALSIGFEAIKPPRPMCLSIQGSKNPAESQSIALEQITALMEKNADFKRFVEQGHLSIACDGPMQKVNIGADGRPTLMNPDPSQNLEPEAKGKRSGLSPFNTRLTRKQ